jgi:molybdopterin converting factor small subunit
MELPEGAAVADLVDRLKLPREEVNPVRKDRALTPPFFKMSIIYFFILAINGGVSNGVKVFFVNGRARPMDWPLKPDDDVGIFPLVAGG